MPLPRLPSQLPARQPTGIRALAYGVLGFGLLCDSARAQDSAQRPDPSTIGQWVQELGDSQFDVRDRASGKLSKLSSDQLDLLKEQLAGTKDPEIVVRLSSVIAKLKAERQQEIVKGFLRDTDILNDHGLHGWSSFSNVAGSNRSSKRLFLQLYDRHPDLVEASLEDPKQAAEVGRKIVQRIQQEEMRRSEADKSDGLALLYCVCASQGSKEGNLAAMSLRILLRAPYNQCLRDPQSKRPIETMMEQWTQSIEGSYEQSTAIQVMLESNLSTAKVLARRMLESHQAGKKTNDEDLDPRDIVRAFQVFFRYGKSEDIPLLEKWLDNHEVCEELASLNPPGGMVPRGQIPGGLPQIPGGLPPGGLPPGGLPPGGNPNPNQNRPLATVELRDAALLTCMQIDGMDYRNFFPSVRQSPLWGFIPSSIALTAGSDAIREARLEAWKKSRP